MERAKKGVKETSVVYEKLTASLKKERVEMWTKEEEMARAQRGDALRIYDIRLEQGIL
jgi:hypothetical protein